MNAASPAANGDVTQLREVHTAIMETLEGYGTQALLGILRHAASAHHADCISRFSPSCSCGHIESQNFLKLLAHTITLAELIRR